MTVFTRLLCGLAVLTSVVNAAPSHGPPAPKSAAGHSSAAAAELKPVDKHEVESFRPYTYYAKAAYCGVATKKSWDCGDSCKQRKNFKLISSGGDGNNTQFWFVGYDPDLKSVIVSHQGTDPSQKGSVATDLDTKLVAMDKALFPHADKKAMVHHGFSVAHARAAKDVLNAVKKTQTTYKDAKKITLVGHSLGAALSLLDALYLSTAIPHVAVSFVGYGMPRAGNKDFANFVDITLKTNIVRINNKNDPVPTLPPIAQDYSHSSGEIHIGDDGKWVRCPGHDNESNQCSTGVVSVADILSAALGNTGAHSGPYDGVDFGKC